MEQAEKDFRQPPKEITREQWLEKLEVLPPVAWVREGGIQTFHLSELHSGNMGYIYCRMGNRYFELQDDVRLSHDQIVNLCCRLVVGFKD